jgi:hypothetical protein
MIEQIQVYTARCFKSSGELFRLSQLEVELTRAMRRVPIGGSEGRRLFARRARVRGELVAAQRAESACSAVERFAGGAA